MPYKQINKIIAFFKTQIAVEMDWLLEEITKLLKLYTVVDGTQIEIKWVRLYKSGLVWAGALNCNTKQYWYIILSAY